mgnify:CR=1 FL=1
MSNRFADSIIAKNTWGDGLYFVFSDVDLAGNFALQLADLVTKQNWEEKGLPRGLNLRIALHAGPVYEFDDPVTGNPSYSGTHVSRAARIEPIAPPSLAYASEAFAALSAAQRTRDFTLRLRRPNPDGQRLRNVADVSRPPELCGSAACKSDINGSR